MNRKIKFIVGDQSVFFDIFTYCSSFLFFSLSKKEWNYVKNDPKYNIWPARKYIGDSIRYFVTEFHTDGIQFYSYQELGYVRYFSFY
jgi:1,4-alpha-glucan branching enzyme